jgi:hypothetical protein
VPELDAVELLARYDSQLRGQLPDRLPEGVHVERDGPLLRFVGFGHGGFVDYHDLGGLDGTETPLITRRPRSTRAQVRQGGPADGSDSEERYVSSPSRMRATRPS